MKHLIWPGLIAALIHVAMVVLPMPPSPSLHSSHAKGTTIQVSMSRKAPSKTASVKPKHPPKVTPIKKAKAKPAEKKKPKKMRHIAAHRATKKRASIVKPVDPVAPPPDPAVSKDEVSEAQPADVTPEPTVANDAQPLKTGGAKASLSPSRMHTPEPLYPKAARRRGYEGTVVLELLVRNDGAVLDVRIKRSSGHGILDRSAVKGVQKWRFTSSLRATPMWVTQPVRFSLTALSMSP